VKFLTSRSLALRGIMEKFRSSENVNFLGCLELLSEYDPFLAAHVQRYGNARSGVTSYTSSSTYEEFVDLMANKLRNNILSEMKHAKYFSFSVDSTPDVTNVELLTFTLHYVLDDGQSVEHFLFFMPIKSHTGCSLYQEIFDTFCRCKRAACKVDECVGVWGKHVTTRRICPVSITAFSRWSKRLITALSMSHALLTHWIYAVSARHHYALMETVFFAFVQNIYVFLSASTHRWNALEEVSQRNKLDSTRTLLPKRLSETIGWCAAYSLKQNYESFRLVLINLSSNEQQTGETRREACERDFEIARAVYMMTVCSQQSF